LQAQIRYTYPFGRVIVLTNRIAVNEKLDNGLKNNKNDQIHNFERYGIYEF